MQNRKNIYKTLKSELREIKNESVMGYIKRPNFSMSGNKEFFAEGNISVDIYTQERIVFIASGTKVLIDGRSLSICFYNRNTMKVSGYIIKIEFEMKP